MKNIAITLFVVSCFLVSCSPEQTIGNKFEIGVRDDVILLMEQALSPHGSSVVFNFSSITANQCEGTGYHHESHQTLNGISIHLINLKLPEPCIGGYSPAKQLIPIASGHGNFELSIDLGDRIHNEGRLTIDEKGFSLAMISHFGIQIPYFEMKRIPQKLVWGYIYHPKFQNQAADIFLHLSESQTDQVLLDAGYYGHFTIDELHKVSVRLTKETSNAESFVFNYNDSPASLEVLVSDIRSHLPDGTQFKLFSWEGKEF